MFSRFIFVLIYVYVSEYMLYATCAGACGGQERASDPLALEL